MSTDAYARRIARNAKLGGPTTSAGVLVGGAAAQTAVLSRPRVIGNRLGIGNNAPSGGNNPPRNSNRVDATYVVEPASYPRVAYAGWWMTNTGSSLEVNQTNPVTYSASLDATFAGSAPPIGFKFGGQNNVTVQPRGDIVASDPIPMKIAAASLVGVRTFATVPSVPQASFTGAISGSVLTVSAVANGIIDVGVYIDFPGAIAGTYVLSRGTGTGGNGTYNLSQSYGSAVAATAMTSKDRWAFARLVSIPLGERSEVGNALTDKTFGTRAVASDTGAAQPLALLGIPDSPQQHSIGIIADSIVQGTGDTADNLGNLGFIERALSRNIAWCSVARFGNGYARNTARDYGQVSFVREYCTDCICELGVNDFNNASNTLADTQTRAIAEWVSVSTPISIGAPYVKVWVTTLPPATTSTDAWATLANQALNSGNTSRIAWNNWLRDGAPILNGAAAATGSSATGTLRMGMPGHPVTGYFEIADLAESSRDSGKWRVDLGQPTTDGTHPTTVVHIAMAAGINIASIKALPVTFYGV